LVNSGQHIEDSGLASAIGSDETYEFTFVKVKIKAVHSFEPQRMTYYSLCGGVALSALDNVFCHKVGLGSPSQVGTQTLHIVSEDGGGSSLHTTGEALRIEQIEVRTLDSFQLSNIGFIKMDVEENELQVLQGAAQTLERSGYPRILFESNTEHLPLFDYIQSLGYTIVSVNGYRNMYLATHQQNL
jgi:FkbM family methyltransferase